MKRNGRPCRSHLDRYTYENLQTKGFAGTDLNTPTGAGRLQFHNVGIAIFPSPNSCSRPPIRK